MKYADFEALVSSPRLNRYLLACANNKKKALVLYRANLRLSQQMFSILGVFEVILRNKVDQHYKTIYTPVTGNADWLLYAANPGGFYANPQCHNTRKSILDGINNLGAWYSHDKLLAELSFGFWRYQFASKEFSAAGSTLHTIFTHRPVGTNHTYIFNKLKLINNIRNRIAHHEPICFDNAGNAISTAYVLQHYNEITDLLLWLNINAANLFYGIDGIQKEVNFINSL